MTRPASARDVAALLHEASYEELPLLLARYGEDPRRQVATAIAAARRRYDHERAERERVRLMYESERELGGTVALGVDEVGRGALAGPLTVCAVSLPTEPPVWGINDSKQLRPQERERLAAQIRLVARAIGIAHVEPARIDAVGMGQAIREGMAEAIRSADIDFESVLIDGNPVHVHPRERTIVKGDAKIASIAAASIVAKVTRDKLMCELDSEYPGYHLADNKGYGSQQHRDAIRELGLSPLHRVTFCGNFMGNYTLF